MTTTNSISNRLTQQFFLLAFGPLLLIALIVPYSVYQIQKEQTLARQYQIAQSLASRINMILNELDFVLHHSAADLSGSSLNSSQQRDMLEELLSYKATFQAVTLIDTNGQKVLGTYYTKAEDNSAKRTYKNSPTFLQAQKSGQLALGPVRYNQDTREPVATAILPIINVQTNRATGYLVATIRLKKAWNVVSDISHRNNVQAYITDNSGKIIAHTDPSVVLKGTEVTMPLLSGLEAGVSGAYSLISYTRLDYANRHFHIGVEEPVKTALDGATEITLYITALIFAALILATWLATRARAQIVNPLKDLNQVVKAIMEGQTSKRAQIIQNDEIGDLAGSFNEMTDRTLTLFQEARRAEKKYRDIFDHAVEGLFQTTLDGTFIDANPSLARMLGYKSSDDLIGSVANISRDIHVDENARQDLMAPLLSGAKMVQRELLCKRKDGSYVWLETTIQAIYDNSGHIAYLEGSAEDITEKKKTDEALKRSHAEDRLQDRLLRHALQSHGLDHYTAVSLDVILNDRSLLNCLDVGAIFINDKPDSTNTLRLATKNNFPPQLQLSCAKIDYGTCLCGKAAVDQQILFTHGHTKEIELSPPEFSENGHCSIPIISGGRTIGVLFLLYAPDQMPGEKEYQLLRRIVDILGMGIARRLDERAIQNMNDELEQRVKERTRELDKANASLEVTAQKAEEANLAKSAFLSRMSHELRTPLNGILGFAQLIQMAREKNSEKVSSFSEQIISAGNHLLNLINEILDLAKIESGQVPLSIETINLEEAIEDTLDIIRPQTKEHNITLEKNWINLPRPALIDADHIRIKQILMNLLSNAVKYNRTNGKVGIDLSFPTEHQLKISISDTGVGIPPESLDRLFSPFERLEAEHSDIEGTGIGLTITRNLVELMEGQIEVESEPGVGSTFHVTFPLPAHKNPAPVGSARPDLRNCAPNPLILGPNLHRVLYVEDNPANLHFMQSVFDQFQEFNLDMATTAAQGIDKARDTRPDLILMDIHLPDINGIDAFKELQKYSTTRDIPVVAVSANAMPSDIKKGLKAGFRDYITKPIDIPQLLDCIHKIFDQN